MLEAEPNKVIKSYVEKDGPKGWQHTDTLKFLYWLHDRTVFTWFSPKDETQLGLPQALYAIARLDVRTLAAYRLTYNPNGIPFEILLNEAHIGRSRWELAESAVHEQCHLFQEYMADQGVPGFQKCTNGYHNRQFCEEIAGAIGLHPVLGAGYHYKPADGQFARLMAVLGIERPPEATDKQWPTVPPQGIKTDWWHDTRPKGSSTLVLYTCDTCPRKPTCKLRAGRRDMAIGCRTCGGEFRVTAS